MKYVIASVLVLVAAFAGCAKTPPSVPTTPVADIRDDRLVFFTVCTDPKGLKVQYVFDWGNGDSETTVYHPSGETVFAARAFPDTGTFHIRAKAHNEAGHTSGWSDACVFHASRPPQLVDTIVGFPRWAVDRWYRPVVKVMDPDGDSVSVKFIWGDSTASNWSPFVASGSTVTDSMKWQTIGRRAVRVVLKDKGSMVNQSTVVKSVNVSQVAILWYTVDSLAFYGCASPTMGELDGEPVLYASTDDGWACLGTDGGIRWMTNLDWEWNFAPSLSNDGSRLYLAQEDAGLTCFDARTGSVVWHTDIPGCVGTPVVGPDGALYSVAGVFRDTAFVLKILDCGDSAHVEWRVPSPFGAADPGWGVAVGANGTIYADFVGVGESRRAAIMALDASGAVLWQDTTHIGDCGETFAPVLDSRGRVILADEDEGNLYCFNQDGALAWKVKTCGRYLYQSSITVGYNDRIYFQAEDELLCCYDSDGQQVWYARIPDGGVSSSSACVLSDSTVLAYDCGDGLLCCLSWNGEVLWTFSLWDSVEAAASHHSPRDEGDGETTPLVGPDGNVYIASDDAVFCVAIGKTRLANTAWPTYNHDNARSGWAGRPQR